MDMILKNTFQSISPAYELIGDATVGTNTTQVDFTGLNIGKDDELLLVSSYSNGLGTYSGYSIFVNSTYTQSNYYSQAVTSYGTTIGKNRVNNANNGFVYGGAKGFAMCRIKLSNNGYFVAQTSFLGFVGASGLEMYDYAVTSTSTISSITSLRVFAETANGIGTGSRFQLYKLVAEKVADIIVPSNTTSVDITGLNIGKDSEYYLTISKAVPNTLNTDADMRIFVNNNTTIANYYYQQIVADGTSVTGARGNSPRIARGNLGNHFSSVNLKLTNSGYFVSQEQRCGALSSTISLAKTYVTSTFTMSDITQITLVSAEANAIGANSRFTLYKLK